jgi:nitroreductase
MDVFDAIRTLLAVRQYQARPVPDATVQRIVEAARLTGSAMNAQPWEFVVVRDHATLRQLGRLAGSGPYVAQAPLAVVVGVERNSRFALSDASRAIQSMMLAAWSEGVGSNWVGFAGMDEVRQLVGMPPALDVVAIVPFGYPARPVGAGRKRRKAMGEIAHGERYGQPFA